MVSSSVHNEVTVKARSNLANKIGAVAATFAIAALIVELALMNLDFGSIELHQAFGFIFGCIVVIASLVSFIVAFFTDKRHRLALIITGLLAVSILS
jgi:hypothetical protein